jgi:hypothetical protein
MTFTLMISLGVLLAAVLSRALLEPSGGLAGGLFAHSQWPAEGGLPLPSGNLG